MRSPGASWLWVAGGVLWTAACGGTPSQSVDARHGSVAEGYSTASHGAGVQGDLGADALRSLIEDAARAAGGTLVGDPRLAVLARTGTIEAWDLEQQGLVEVAPELHRFEATSLEGLAQALRSELPALLSGAGFTHYGAALELAQSGPALQLILGRRPLRFDAPVPRRVEPGRVLRLRGTLLGYRDAELVQVDPHGRRATFTAGTGERFDVQLGCTRVGAHRIELWGVGPEGKQLLARLRVHAGVEPAPPPRPGTAGAADLVALRQTWLAAINRTRAAEGLAALAQDGMLDALAARHAASWIEVRRAGRPLQHVHGAAESARKSGRAGSLAQDLIVQADRPAAFEGQLLSDALARSALLAPWGTRLGLGVVADPDGGHWVLAGVVVQRAEPIDLGRAAAKLLSLVNAARRARGAAALELDPQLAALAGEQARAFFAPPLPSQSDTVAAVNAGLDTAALRYRRTEALLAAVRSVEEAATLEPALASDASAVGIGVGQGDRPDTGARSLAVVVVLAWPH